MNQICNGSKPHFSNDHSDDVNEGHGKSGTIDEERIEEVVEDKKEDESKVDEGVDDDDDDEDDNDDDK